MRRLFFVGILFIFLSCAQAEDDSIIFAERISSKDLESYDKVVLLFWTTWCPYCAIQVRIFNDYCEELSAKGFKIFLVNVQESEAKVKLFKERTGGIRCPIILDRLGDMAYKYRILGIPTYIFLREGREIGRTSFINKRRIEELYNE